ncbi:MAG TPA: hypothetical protein VKQ28_00710 [Candidatus Acidoferrum sp.]|nr:hypothetical protein [Candidatus Acidoferrum sp.]
MLENLRLLAAVVFWVNVATAIAGLAMLTWQEFPITVERKRFDVTVAICLSCFWAIWAGLLFFGHAAN